MKKDNISKIINFTDKLNEKENTYCFNPSIAHWKNDLYLVCYRRFVRFPDSEKDDEKLENENKRNHPWLKGSEWASRGSDKTGFCIMKIANDNIELYKPLNDGKSITYNDETYKPIDEKYMEGHDARLIKVYDNTFLISYNLPFFNSNIQLKNGDCENGCILIVTRTIDINRKEILELGDESIFCQQISNTIEKNWSFFNYKNNLFFSYGLTPKHIIYNMMMTFEGGICFPDNKLEDDHNYFGNYEKETNLLKISVSTPAIQNIENQRYIGVGHVKYENKNGDIKQIEMPLKDFLINKEKNYKRHYKYDYFMFIYEFEPKTGEITRISDMFIPEDSEYLLVFPSGLIFIEDKLCMFYGVHDSNCKSMIIKHDIVSKLLKKPRDVNSFHIDEINFFTFPTKCYKKSDICKLINMF